MCWGNNRGNGRRVDRIAIFNHALNKLCHGALSTQTRLYSTAAPAVQLNQIICSCTLCSSTRINCHSNCHLSLCNWQNALYTQRTLCELKRIVQHCSGTGCATQPDYLQLQATLHSPRQTQLLLKVINIRCAEDVLTFNLFIHLLRL